MTATEGRTGSISAAPAFKRADAAGVSLAYHDAGRGPAVLLLHGGGPGASAWGNFFLNIDPLTAQFRVVAVDLPGFGDSDPVVFHEDRAKGNVPILMAFLDAIGIDKAHLVGNSMGGATAIEIAVTYPDRVGRLVLIGAGGGGPSVFHPQPTEGDKLLRTAFRDSSRENIRRLIEVMVYDPTLVTDEMVEERVRSASNPAQRDARARSARKQGEPLSDLAAVAAPTLVVWGRDDRFNPYDQGLRMLTEIPDCRLHLFSRCGHWAQIEHAAEFNALVSMFLAGHP